MSGLWEAVDLCLLREGDGGDHPHLTSERADGTFGARETPFCDHVVLGSYLDDLMAERGRIAQGEDDDDVSIPEEVSLFESDSGAASDQESDGELVEESWEDDAIGCETEDDGQEREEGSLGTAPLPTSTIHGPSGQCQSHHELFLPRGVSPSTESLKYQEDDDESSDDEEDFPSHFYGTDMIGSERPPSRTSAAACVSSDSSSDGSLPSKAAKRKAPSKAGGVSFSESVTVHPIFETEAYPPSIVERMYTGRQELRANRRRNLLEYSHDLNDWRNATEEDEMEANDEGELIHPASLGVKDGEWVTVAPPQRSPCRRGGDVRTYSSAMGGDPADSRKRMRVSCP